jgi:putative ATPase
MDGVAALRDVVATARNEAAFRGATTVVFLDEVHRYSKAQQDALLPHVEAGTIVLVGATTEAPFGGGITRPLLSRLRVFRLEPLGEAELREIAARALGDEERGLGSRVSLDEVALRQLIGYASGDARRLLGILEAAVAMAGADGRTAIEPADVARAAQSATLDYDRSGVVSAFIKSIRGSDPDAALYWLATALEAGEDPRYMARRLVVSASEDVGMGEPGALPLALAALEAVEKIGAETNDEGLYALAQATTALAVFPKSSAAGRAYFAARDELRANGSLPVPGYLRPSAKTYRHPDDWEDGWTGQGYLPATLAGRRYYYPNDAGQEAALAARMAQRAARKALPPRQKG